MRKTSAVILLVVIAQLGGALASLPAWAASTLRSGGHRLAAHPAVRHPASRSRDLIVRRSPRSRGLPVTRDFDPVPLGGGPIVNFIRDVEEVYGHDLPFEPRPAVQPWVFDEF